MFLRIDNLVQNKRWALGIIFAVTQAAYGNIYHKQFVMDDFDFIVDWPLIRDWKNFSQFFAGYVPSAGQEGIYSSLRTLFHAVFYYLFGLNPLCHHVVSLLIHLTAVYFVY